LVREENQLKGGGAFKEIYYERRGKVRVSATRKEKGVPIKTKGICEERKSWGGEELGRCFAPTSRGE